MLEVLLSADARPNVLRALRTGRPAARKLLAALVERVEGPGDLELLNLATRSGDHALVTRAVRRRLEKLAGSSDEEQQAVARDLHGRTRSTARALALAAWFATSSPPDADTTRAALLDPSAEVRELARFEVGRRDLGIDVLALAHAATAVGTARDRARAIGILAEVGERRAELFTAFTAANLPPRVREAAYLALDTLGVYLDDEALLDLLQAPSARMARAAGRLLRRRGMSPRALARVHELAGARPPPDAPDRIRRLARALVYGLPVPRDRPRSG